MEPLGYRIRRTTFYTLVSACYRCYLIHTKDNVQCAVTLSNLMGIIQLN